MSNEESKIIQAIKAQFCIEANRRFLLPEWRKRHRESNVASTGFCYVATHAYFELMGGSSSQLVIKKWVDTPNPADGHFWVEKESGEIVDLTADQYKTGFKHYAEGKLCKRGSSAKAKLFTNVVREFLDRK
jgi:hypothetical protein